MSRHLKFYFPSFCVPAPDISVCIFVQTGSCFICVFSCNSWQEKKPHLLSALPLLSISHYLLLLGFVGYRVTFVFITSRVLCIASPAPPPSGPPSTLTPGGSSTLSKKRPPPPPPGHKRTLSDPPSPLSHSPHSKGGLTGGETQTHTCKTVAQA